jgi:hypothetical protein
MIVPPSHGNRSAFICSSRGVLIGHPRRDTQNGHLGQVW